MGLLHARLLTIGAAAAATAFAASGCGAGDSAQHAASSAKNAVDPVAQAADVTSAQKGGIAMTITGQVSAAGQNIPMHGTGTFDRKGKLGQMSLTTRVGGRSLTIDEITQGRTFYMSSDAFKSELPSGKSWLKLDLDKFAKAKGIDLSALAGNGAQGDPSQALEYLKGAGTSTKVGSETVDGVPTTHYHVVVDLRKAAAKSGAADAKSSVEKLIRLTGTSTIPVDVWVDKDHLVRRETMKYDETIQGQKMTMAMTIDMTKFGVEITAKVPPASETVDGNKLLGAQGGASTSTRSGTISG
jgi:hypothetical protein